MAGGQALEGDSIKRKSIFEIAFGSKDVEIRKAIDPGSAEYQDRATRDFIEAHVQSIMNVGILQPARGYRDGEAGKKQIVVIVYGNGRLTDWLEAGRRYVAEGGLPEKFWPFRVEIIRPDSKFSILEAKQIENHARLAADPMQDAREAYKMLEVGGADPEAGPQPETQETWDRVRVAFGCEKIKDLQSLIRRLHLDDKIQAAVSSGEVSVTAAMILADKPREEQVAEFEKMKAAGTLTVRAALKEKSKAVATRKGKDPSTAGWRVPGMREIKGAMIAELAIKLSAARIATDKKKLEGVLYAANYFATGEDPEKLFKK